MPAAFALCLTVRQPFFEPGPPAGPATSTQKGHAMRYRTLCKNKEFSRVYARGKSYVHPHMVLYVAKNRLGHTRIGLTATKKVGKAVQRNRARRVMRAALSEHLAADVGGYDIILVARAQTPKLKSTQVSRTLAKLMRAAGLPDRARLPRPDGADKP